MEEIKAPKKERRFLKAMGEVALTLFRDLLLNVGKKVINKVGKKREGLVIAFVVLTSSFAFAQYPTTGNKQRLGYQTTGDGLVWRGRASDTISLKSTGLNNAYIIIDTLQNVMYNYIKTKGGWQFNNTDTVIINNNFTQPVDSLFFKTSVSPNNVDTAKMRWDFEKGTVVLGMYDAVPNELGFKNFWLVKNQTGSLILKGSLVYASGTVGSSGRISVSKFIANGTIDAKYLLGITAHDLSNGEDGYVISFGKIRQVNTDTFAAGAILYPSPTVAGVWTDVEPVAPNLDMPIGFCINSSSNNGTIAIRVASGYKLDELHDARITSPVDKASLFYSGGLWRDTTASLLVSDTASMLTNYLRTGVAASTYLTQSNAAITYLPLTGGTLTGSLNGTTGTFTGLNVTNASTEGILTLQGADNNTATRIRFNTTGSIRKEIVLPTATSNLEFRTSTVGGTEGGYSFYTRRNPNAEQLAFNIDYNKDIQMYGSLSVTGATTLSDDLILRTYGGSRFQTAIRHYYEQQSRYAGEIQFLPSGSSGSALVFITNQSGFGQSERMRINELGNIGINTSLPNAKLDVRGSVIINEDSEDNDTRIESDGNANMVFVDASTDRVGIGTNTPSKTLDVVGDANVSGNLTEGGNNVMTNLDTVSLSNRINNKVGLTGDDIISGTKTFNSLVNLTSNLILSGSYSETNKLLGKNSSNGVGNITVGSGLNLTSDILTATQIDTTSLSNRINGKVGLTGNETVAGNKTLSGNTTFNGTVTMSSTSATPTSLIGINASNVIGDVTTVEQTGIFARGVITNQTTSTGGVVTLTHGLSWTPLIAFANLPDANTNIVNVAFVNDTYILFVIRDGATNNVLNTQNVPAIQWFAIK